MKYRLVMALLITSTFFMASCKEEAQNQPQKVSRVETANTVKPKFNWPGDLANVVSQDNLTQTNIMIVYDDSGSMADSACGRTDNKTRYDEAVVAMKQFISSIPFNINIGLYAMNRGLMVPLGPNNHKLVEQATFDARPSGGTPIASAMRQGYEQLTTQGKTQLGYGRYILLVITDGAANAGEDPYQFIKNIFELQIPIEIHAIGMCMGENHSLRQNGYTFYTAANDTDTLIRGLKSVLAESPEFDIKFNNE